MMWAAAGFLLVTACFAVPARAEEASGTVLPADPYSITVTVEATGKDKAMELADQEAFKQLMTKLLGEGKAKERIAAAGGKTISGMVRGYGVVEEKISANKYKTTLTVRFDPKQIRDFSGTHAEGDADVSDAAPAAPKTPPHSEAESTAALDRSDWPAIVQGREAVLVMPLWIEKGEKVPLEADTYWKRFWNDAALDTGQGKMLIASGDSKDKELLARVQPGKLPTARLAALASRYGASSVVVAEAEYKDDATLPRPTLVVTMTRANAQGAETKDIQFESKPGESRELLFRRAIAELAKEEKQKLLGNAEKFQAMPPPPPENNILAGVRLFRIADWAALRERLLAKTIVSNIEIVSMAPSRIEAKLTYLGTPEQLGKSLMAANIVPSQEGSLLMLKMRP